MRVQPSLVGTDSVGVSADAASSLATGSSYESAASGAAADDRQVRVGAESVDSTNRWSLSRRPRAGPGVISGPASAGGEVSARARNSAIRASSGHGTLSGSGALLLERVLRVAKRRSDSNGFPASGSGVVSAAEGGAEAAASLGECSTAECVPPARIAPQPASNAQIAIANQARASGAR